MNINNLSALTHLPFTTYSNNVRKNSIFFVTKSCTNTDFHIKKAIILGAKYIISEKKYFLLHLNIFFLLVYNVKLVLNIFLINKYKKIPSNIVAITGTNGKTSVTFFFMQILFLLGYKAASMGTLGMTDKKCRIIRNIKNNLTTPSSVEVYKYFSNLIERKYNYISLEASSHGLTQSRIDTMRINSAVFTSFSYDHIDYHLNINNYFKAKSKLFGYNLNPGNATILNYDLKEYKILKEICLRNKLRILNYGLSSNEFKILSIRNKIIKIFGHVYILNTSVFSFQLYNIIISIILCYFCNFRLKHIFNILPKLNLCKGRLELVTCFNKAKIYVDYTHTPNSFFLILKELRNICKGKIYVIFGCGGDRDRKKRNLMGFISKKKADVIYITDDNPRNESPSLLRSDILYYCPGGIEISNRIEAISRVIKKLSPNDILLVSGKGHENYQIYNNIIRYYNDVEAIKNLVL